MVVSVKMKETKKTMVATLIIVMVLAVGVIPISAQPDNAPGITSNPGVGKGNRQGQLKSYRESLRARIQQAKPDATDLSTLDESDVDPRIAEALEAEAIADEENAFGALWILNVHGTTVTVSPVTDAELNADRIGLQLVAEKIKNTELGAVYEVHWGRILHDEERVEIEGYAILDSDGVFYMKLEGEDLDFKAIGRIAPAMHGVRVAMKGYMTHDGIQYSHEMQGRAIPFGWFNRVANQVRRNARPTPEEATVEPTRVKPVTGSATPA